MVTSPDGWLIYYGWQWNHGMIYVVGGGSIASRKVSSRVNLTNAFSDSCAVYDALTMRLGVGRESQPDLLPLVCQRMTKSLAVTPRGGLAAWVGSRYNPKALVSMMDCLCQAMCKAKGVYLG